MEEIIEILHVANEIIKRIKLDMDKRIFLLNLDCNLTVNLILKYHNK